MTAPRASWPALDSPRATRARPRVTPSGQARARRACRRRHARPRRGSASRAPGPGRAPSEAFQGRDGEPKRGDVYTVGEVLARRLAVATDDLPGVVAEC